MTTVSVAARRLIGLYAIAPPGGVPHAANTSAAAAKPLHPRSNPIVPLPTPIPATDAAERSGRRPRSARRAAGIALCAAVLAACGKADTRPGAVTGDAYIVTDEGQEVSLAAMPVALLADTVAVDSALARLCPRRTPGAPAPDSAMQAQAWQRRAQLLAGRALKRATTSAAARFRLDSVAPGKYRVWADTAYGGQRWSWLQPVTVKPGDSATVALSNANPDDNPFRCTE